MIAKGITSMHNKQVTGGISYYKEKRRSEAPWLLRKILYLL